MILLQESFTSNTEFLVGYFSSSQIYKIFQVEMSIYNGSMTAWA